MNNMDHKTFKNYYKKFQVAIILHTIFEILWDHIHGVCLFQFFYNNEKKSLGTCIK